MRKMIDQNGTIISEYDFTKGHLVESKLFVKHHEAVEAAEEVGHFEVVAEYDNGGKDVTWIVDSPAVKAREAFDEYEDVWQFVPFTQAELAALRVRELKQKLKDTDYHILKIVEGAITLADCAEIIKQRAQWRKEINDLEQTEGED